MSHDTHTRGFTTAILHSDRDGGDRARRAAQAAARVGRLRLPATRTTLAAVFQNRQPGYVYGRQGNPTSAALEAKVTAMEGGVATVSLRHRHGGDRRDRRWRC